MRKEAQPRWRKIRFGDSLDLMLRDKWLGQVEPQIADRCRYTTQGGAGVAGSQDEAKRRVLEAAGYNA